MLSDLFHFSMLSFFALFPIINPIGNAFIINNFCNGITGKERKIIVTKIAIRSFFFGVIALLVGKFLLMLFGLSIPVIQITGGAIIFRTGWSFLSDDDEAEKNETNSAAQTQPTERFSFKYLLEHVFYPLTFPISIGAGASATIFALAADATVKSHSWWEIGGYLSAIAISLAMISATIYIFYINTPTVERFLGKEGKTIINKVSAFFTAAVGLQIVLNGLSPFINR